LSKWKYNQNTLSKYRSPTGHMFDFVLATGTTHMHHITPWILWFHERIYAFQGFEFDECSLEFDFSTWFTS